MRDNKISLLLLASFLLLLASFLVLCTWGYNFYTKVEKASVRVNPPVKNTNSQGSRDSLLKLYTQTIRQFDEQLSGTLTNGDSLENDLQFKLDEYYRVKNELAVILKSPSSTLDTDAARNKIAELQQKIRLLQTTNTSVTEENKKLYALLENLKKSTVQSAPPNQSTALQKYVVQNVRNTEQQRSPEKASVSVYDLDLSPVKDPEDTQNELSGILGSFIVKNSGNAYNAELMIVVVQPNGKVVQKSAWESGTFNSREGKKIYSCKMFVENIKGETKRLSFSINNDKYQKGNYTFQIYLNGQSLGKINKNLS